MLLIETFLLLTRLSGRLQDCGLVFSKHWPGLGSFLIPVQPAIKSGMLSRAGTLVLVKSSGPRSSMLIYIMILIDRPHKSVNRSSRTVVEGLSNGSWHGELTEPDLFVGIYSKPNMQMAGERNAHRVRMIHGR